MSAEHPAASASATIPEDVRDVWPGHTSGELEAYRDGFADALRWALNHEQEEIEAVLDADQDHELLTELEELVVLHNRWITLAHEAQNPVERVVLNGCARELREALYGC